MSIRTNSDTLGDVDNGAKFIEISQVNGLRFSTDLYFNKDFILSEASILHDIVERNISVRGQSSPNFVQETLEAMPIFR